MTSAEASPWRPAPMARATAAAIAPPMLEFATCCISMTSGNTSEMPASAFGPNRPMKCASTDAVTAMSTTLTTIFGGPRRSNVKTIGPCRRTRVREAVPWDADMPALELALGMLSFVIGTPAPRGTGQHLGEMPDRVSERTRRRNAGERNSGQRVTAARRAYPPRETRLFLRDADVL